MPEGTSPQRLAGDGTWTFGKIRWCQPQEKENGWSCWWQTRGDGQLWLPMMKHEVSNFVTCFCRNYFIVVLPKYRYRNSKCTLFTFFNLCDNPVCTNGFIHLTYVDYSEFSVSVRNTVFLFWTQKKKVDELSKVYVPHFMRSITRLVSMSADFIFPLFLHIFFSTLAATYKSLSAFDWLGNFLQKLSRLGTC